MLLDDALARATLAVLLLTSSAAAAAPRQGAAPDLRAFARDCAAGNARACRQLVEIADSDKDFERRKAAIGLISEPADLIRLATAAASDGFDRVGPAVERLAAVSQPDLARLAVTAGTSRVRLAAVRWLEAQDVLSRIARTDADVDVRTAAVRKVDDRAVLEAVARDDKDPRLREEAARRITTAAPLAAQALCEKGEWLGKGAGYAAGPVLVLFSSGNTWQRLPGSPVQRDLSPSEPGTLLCITETTTQVPGAMYTNFSAAFRTQWTVAARRWPDGAFVQAETVTGSDPPRTIQTPGTGVGSPPTLKEVLDALGNLALRAAVKVDSLARDVAVSPNGTLVAECGAALTVREMKTGRLLWSKAAECADPVFSLDETKLATGRDEGTGPGNVTVWDSRTGTVLHTSLAVRSTEGLAFSPDGARLAVGHDSSRVSILDLQRGRRVCALRDKALDRVAGFLAGGNRFATTSQQDVPVRVWSATTCEQEMATTGNPATTGPGPALSPDGRFVVYPEFQGPGALWDLAARRPVALPRDFCSGDALAVSPEGRTVACVSGSRILLWDTAEGIRTALRGHPGVDRLAFSLDGRTLFTIGDRQSIKAFDLAAARTPVLPPGRQD